MKLVCLKILKAIEGMDDSTVTRLSEKTGFALSSISEGVKDLEKRGILARENGRIVMAKVPVGQEFLHMSSKYSPEKILKGTREKLVLELVEPKTPIELQKAIGVSWLQLSRLLKGLLGVGAVFLDGEKYFLNEDVKKFAEELKKVKALKGTEPYAIILFSNSFRLKRVPLNAKARGTLTGFSRFAGHGVEYVIIRDTLVEPEHELSIEEILVHALCASENKKDIAMCLIFYEKNKEKMEIRKLIGLSKEFKVLGLFLDCLAYLDKREPKDKLRFLSWGEFKAIAKDYGASHGAKQKYTAKELEALFEEIGKNLGKPMKVFLIGGCNMALQGIKQSTKDIDLIVKDKVDFETLHNILTNMGFKPLVDIETTYRKMQPSEILVMQGKPRVDIFTRIVCNALTLSDTMIDKSIEKKYGSLSVNFVKPEDIILFKSITDREGDLEDIKAIIKNQEPDWAFFLSELDRQHDISERLFCLDVLATLEVLEEKEKIEFEIKEKLVGLCLEKGIMFLARKPVSVREIMQKLDFVENTLRNKITQLVKNGRLKKTGEKPFRVVGAGR